MVKITKIIMCLMFITLSVLFTVAVIENGKKSKTEDLKKMEFENNLILAIDSYHNLGD